jgi:hypothetical protein
MPEAIIFYGYISLLAALTGMLFREWRRRDEPSDLQVRA